MPGSTTSSIFGHSLPRSTRSHTNYHSQSTADRQSANGSGRRKYFSRHDRTRSQEDEEPNHTTSLVQTAKEKSRFRRKKHLESRARMNAATAMPTRQDRMPPPPSPPSEPPKLGYVWLPPHFDSNQGGPPSPSPSNLSNAMPSPSPSQGGKRKLFKLFSDKESAKEFDPTASIRSTKSHQEPRAKREVKPSTARPPPSISSKATTTKTETVRTNNPNVEYSQNLFLHRHARTLQAISRSNARVKAKKSEQHARSRKGSFDRTVKSGSSGSIERTWHLESPSSPHSPPRSTAARSQISATSKKSSKSATSAVARAQNRVSIAIKEKAAKVDRYLAGEVLVECEDDDEAFDETNVERDRDELDYNSNRAQSLPEIGGEDPTSSSRRNGERHEQALSLDVAPRHECVLSDGDAFLNPECNIQPFSTPPAQKRKIAPTRDDVVLRASSSKNSEFNRVLDYGEEEDDYDEPIPPITPQGRINLTPAAQAKLQKHDVDVGALHPSPVPSPAPQQREPVISKNRKKQDRSPVPPPVPPSLPVPDKAPQVEEPANSSHADESGGQGSKDPLRMFLASLEDMELTVQRRAVLQREQQEMIDARKEIEEMAQGQRLGEVDKGRVVEEKIKQTRDVGAREDELGAMKGDELDVQDEELERQREIQRQMEIEEREQVLADLEKQQQEQNAKKQQEMQSRLAQESGCTSHRRHIERFEEYPEKYREAIRQDFEEFGGPERPSPDLFRTYDDQTNLGARQQQPPPSSIPKTASTVTPTGNTHSHPAELRAPSGNSTASSSTVQARFQQSARPDVIKGPPLQRPPPTAADELFSPVTLRSQQSWAKSPDHSSNSKSNPKTPDTLLQSEKGFWAMDDSVVTSTAPLETPISKSGQLISPTSIEDFDGLDRPLSNSAFSGGIENPEICSGYLSILTHSTKKLGTTINIRIFKRRYFTLTRTGMLSYRKSMKEDPRTALGKRWLKGTSFVSACENFQYQGRAKRFVFRVGTPDETPWTLDGEDGAMMKMWMESIREFIVKEQRDNPRRRSQRAKQLADPVHDLGTTGEEATYTIAPQSSQREYVADTPREEMPSRVSTGSHAELRSVLMRPLSEYPIKFSEEYSPRNPLANAEMLQVRYDSEAHESLDLDFRESRDYGSLGTSIRENALWQAAKHLRGTPPMSPTTPPQTHRALYKKQAGDTRSTSSKGSRKSGPNRGRTDISTPPVAQRNVRSHTTATTESHDWGYGTVSDSTYSMKPRPVNHDHQSDETGEEGLEIDEHDFRDIGEIAADIQGELAGHQTTYLVTPPSPHENRDLPPRSLPPPSRAHPDAANSTTTIVPSPGNPWATDSGGTNSWSSSSHPRDSRISPYQASMPSKYPVYPTMDSAELSIHSNGRSSGTTYTGGDASQLYSNYDSWNRFQNSAPYANYGEGDDERIAVMAFKKHQQQLAALEARTAAHEQELPNRNSFLPQRPEPPPSELNHTPPLQATWATTPPQSLPGLLEQEFQRPRSPTRAVPVPPKSKLRKSQVIHGRNDSQPHSPGHLDEYSLMHHREA